MPDQQFSPGGGSSFGAASYFNDPDEDTLGYAVMTSNARVVTASASGSTITIGAVARGSARVAVTATDPGGLSAEQSFTVTVGEPVSEQFDIDHVVIGSSTKHQRRALRRAKKQWISALAGTELPDILLQGNGLECHDLSTDKYIGTVDDLIILVEFGEIDGLGGALAAAVPCGLRAGSLLPFLGTMWVDATDTPTLESDDLEDVIRPPSGDCRALEIEVGGYSLRRPVGDRGVRRRESGRATGAPRCRLRTRAATAPSTRIGGDRCSRGSS